MNLNKKIITFLLIGFFFRLFIIFCLPVRTFENTIKRYHYAAINMIEGRGYSHFDKEPYQPSFYKPPAYPIFLAIIYKIFGVNLNAVRIIQILFDLLGCLLLFYLGSYYFEKKIAFIIFSLALFFPITAVYANVVNPESLTMFLMMFSLFLIAKSVRSGKPLVFFWAGVSTILMAYCRQEFFPLVFIFSAYIFINQKKKGFLGRKIFLYFLGVFIIMAPWVARNYKLTGKFIPLNAGGGLGVPLYFGTLGDITNDEASLNTFLKSHPEIEKKYTQWYEKILFNPTALEEKYKYDKVFVDMALDNIKKDPLDYLVMCVRRIPMVWINLHADEFTFLNTQKLRLLHPDYQKIIHYLKDDPKEVAILILKYLLFAINILYLVMALAGLWASRKMIFQLSFIIVPLIYAQAFFFFMHMAHNYTIPYWPCIIFFSGIGMYYISCREAFNKSEL